MATYGQEYDKLLKSAKSHLEAAERASTDGDLWNAHIHLQKAGAFVDNALSLIEEVSKTAFERVFREKAHA